MKRALITASLLTVAGFTPVILADTEFLLAYQAPITHCQALATSTESCTPPSIADDGSGLYSVAVFKDRDGNRLESQIKNSLYEKLTKKGGFNHNPKRSERISIIEALTLKAKAAIAFDNVDANETAADAGSVTWAHNTGTGDNRIIVVSARGLGGDTISSGTYNGEALSLGVKQFVTGSSGRTQYLWYRKAPTSGSNNVTLNRTGTQSIGGRAATYTGAAQTGGVDSASVQEEASGSRTVTVNVTTANSWLVANYASLDADPTATVNGTGRPSTPVSSQISDSNAAVGSGNQTIGFNWDTTDRHVIIAIAFAPAVAAAAATDNGDIITFE